MRKVCPTWTTLRRIKGSGNARAIRVKLADLKHNSDLTRLDAVDEAALTRLEKYREAARVLNGP